MLYSTLWASGLVSWGAGGQCMARSTWPEVGFEHSCIPLLLCYKVSQPNRASYSLVPDSRIPSLHSRSQYQTGNVKVKSRAMLNKVIADFTLLSSLCEHATTVAQRRELHRTLEIYCVQQQKCKRPAVVGNWTLSCATSALSMVEHWLHKPGFDFQWQPAFHFPLFSPENIVDCSIMRQEFYAQSSSSSLYCWAYVTRITEKMHIQSIVKHLAVHILRLVYQARPSLTFLLTFLEGERWSSVID